MSAPASVQDALHLRMRAESFRHGRDGAADPLQRRQRQPRRLLPGLNADAGVGECLQGAEPPKFSEQACQKLYIGPFRDLPGCPWRTRHASLIAAGHEGQGVSGQGGCHCDAPLCGPAVRRPATRSQATAAPTACSPQPPPLRALWRTCINGPPSAGMYPCTSPKPVRVQGSELQCCGYDIGVRANVALIQL